MDKFIFNDESPAPVTKEVDPWKVLIVDDEEGVHQVTKLTLNDFVFEGRPLHFLHAYSAKEAVFLLNDNADIAMILLDVVMESNHAGLDLVKIIRNEMKNITVRIVLRTGQPGQAPEQEVIRDYDINDYKNKTELTSNRMFTLMYATLRAYRDITVLQKSKKGLEKLILASRGISSRGALTEFIQATVQQINTLLNIEDSLLFSCKANALSVVNNSTGLYLLHGDDGSSKQIIFADLPASHKQLIRKALDEQNNIFAEDQFVIYCSNQNHIILFFASMNQSLADFDVDLLNIFTENLIISLENINLNELIAGSQKEMIYSLGEVIESRSRETGNHVKRVAHYSHLLATLIGLPLSEAELLKTASPLHDIGKIGIADNILVKPGKLTAQEWAIIKTHPQRGYDILQASSLMVMNICGIIALTHHEKWDGSGYPNGLKGEDIHLYGRITALADVFDALGSDRCYKKAWPLDEVIQEIKAGSGKHFDPRLTDLFLDNLDGFISIREHFKD